MTDLTSEKIGEIVVELANLSVDGRGFVSGRKLKPLLDRLQFLKAEVEHLEGLDRKVIVLPFRGKINQSEVPDDTPPAA